MTSTEATVKRTRRRRMVYCLLPADLAPGLHDPLRLHFRGDPDIEVVVERRRRDRRRRGERRRVDGEPPSGVERRRIKSPTGRRIGERRATLMPLDRPPPLLPPAALPHAERINFVRRLEPPSREAEDRDAARLVTRFQGGDPEAFTILYSRYFNRVYAYLRVMLKDSHEAEDAAQQVFVKVLEALPVYERRRQSFGAWFFTVVRHVAFDYLRRRARVEPREVGRLDGRSQPVDAAPLDPAALWIGDREIAGLLDELSFPQRQAIVAHFVLGLNSEETGRLLGRSSGAVRGLRHRGLRALRRRLGDRAPWAPRRSAANCQA